MAKPLPTPADASYWPPQEAPVLAHISEDAGY
jgi:hypothetical protein